MASEQLPEWVQYVAGAISLIIVSVVAKLGWGSQTKQNSSVEVAGAIVDNKAAEQIVESIHGASRRYVDCHEEQMRVMRETNNELRTLHQEIRELSREVSLRNR